MITDTMSVKGKVEYTLFDEKGKVKEHNIVPNLVVNTGKNFIASRMASAAATVMGYMAVGTNGTGASVTDTALLGEVARVALTSTTVSTNTVQYAATFGAGVGTGSLQEAGIFDIAVAGTMLCRTVFTTIPKGAGDTLAITWTITVS